MIVDIEDDIMDPVMQCTTLPSHSSFSQKKLVSFVTEIHTLSIDISLRDCLDDGVAALFQRSRIHKPHARTHAFKVNRLTSRSLILNFPTIKEPQTQVDQGSQIKMIQVKEMMQDNDLKNSKSKDKGSRSRSQSMNDQSHYKQDKTKNKAKHKRQKSYLQPSKEDNPSGSSFWNVKTSSTITTPIVNKTGKLEKVIIDGKKFLVDDEGKLLKKPTERVGFDNNSLLEQWRDTYENVDYDYDPYDDDMYEGHEISDKIQSICDSLDIKVRGRKKK
ncbi:hypothetical protein Tco_1014115 [Tanacetum coccineum]